MLSTSVEKRRPSVAGKSEPASTLNRLLAATANVCVSVPPPS